MQKVFTFNGTTDIQVVMINGEPYFVAQDVCSVLQLQNPTARLKERLFKDEYLTYELRRAGQQRAVNVVNESGLYALILQSRKPIARTFRKWVTSEVLPAIRKTGVYVAKSEQPQEEAERKVKWTDDPSIFINHEYMGRRKESLVHYLLLAEQSRDYYFKQCITALDNVIELQKDYIELHGKYNSLLERL